MNLKENINKTLYIFKENIGELLKVFLVFILIEYLVDLILGINSINEFIYRGPNYHSRKLFKNFISLYIGQILLASQQLTLLDLVRGGSFGIEEVYNKFKKEWKLILPISFALTLILFVLDLVPLVGWILSIFGSIVFSFTYLLIGDYEGGTPIDYLKLSFNRTEGYRMNILKIFAIYRIVPIFLMLLLLLIIGFSIKSFFFFSILTIILLVAGSLLYSLGLVVEYDFIK